IGTICATIGWYLEAMARANMRASRSRRPIDRARRRRGTPNFAQRSITSPQSKLKTAAKSYNWGDSRFLVSGGTLQSAPQRAAPGVPRVAFLTDTFHEINGAARTCREFAAFAQRRGCPFLSVRFGQHETFAQHDSFWMMEQRRSPLSIGVDPDL